MASISVTNTFTNGSTADASEVNTNFSDIINGTSDGTKDLSVAALTCASTVTFNGNVTIGNATSDTVTFTGRVASSILPSTDNANDLGSSALKWADIRGVLATFTGAVNATDFVASLGAEATPSHTFTGDLNTGMWSSAADTLEFSTAGAKVLTIDSSGLIGVGKTPFTGGSATYTLQLASGSTQTFMHIGNSSTGTAITDGMAIGNDGNRAYIEQREAQSLRIQSGGTGGVDLLSTGTSWTAVSDRRKKKNIATFNYGLSEILQLTPVRFDYIVDNSDSSVRMGFIAQDVEAVIPEAVSQDHEGIYGMAQTEFIPTLVKAIQEQQTLIESLTARIEKLEAS